MAKKSENIIDIVKTINNYEKMIIDQKKELWSKEKEIKDKNLEIAKLTQENNQLKATIKEFSNNLGPYLNTEENRKLIELGKLYSIKLEEKKNFIKACGIMIAWCFGFMLLIIIGIGFLYATGIITA